MVVRGKNILFSVGGQQIACSESAEISILTNFRKATQPNSSKGDHNIPDKIRFLISIGGPLDFVFRSNIYVPMENFTTVNFSYFTADVADGKFDGVCWVQSWGEVAPTGGIARFNARFIGDGLPVFTKLSESHWIDEAGNILTDATPDQFLI